VCVCARARARVTLRRDSEGAPGMIPCGMATCARVRAREVEEYVHRRRKKGRGLMLGV
jgi:hypothetical protein